MMEAQQLDFDDYASAIAKRNAAMVSVTLHAEQNCKGWTVGAMAWIAKYAETHAMFISEECTAAAIEAGVPMPHDKRGWGSLYPASARRGVIAQEGYGKSKNRNMSCTPMWRSLHPNFTSAGTRAGLTGVRA
jgi:hypothetical protein